MLSFGQRLKKIRQERSFSQSYIAENIGVSVQSVSNWECDNTMPDISQIVPLAGVLDISTDFLLGNDSDESADLEKLERDIEKIWATYSVNTPKNNADYIVYELYSQFLRKYPLNYKIKYKNALAIHDYLVVSRIRHKFEITEREFSRLYAECEKLLSAICKYDRDLQRQIEARSLLVKHYTLNKQWEKALEMADTLPDICGLKQDNNRVIAQSSQKRQEAQSAAFLTARAKCQEYVMSLYYLARCISDNENDSPKKTIEAWSNMADASRTFIYLYADSIEPAVNAYEQNPYCYLITAYASMCNDYLRFKDQTKALFCLKKATETAVELYHWGVDRHADKLVMEDILFFVSHTPGWCCNKVSKDEAANFTEQLQYKECEKRLEQMIKQ